MVKRLEMNHKGLPEFDENGTWVFFSDYHTLEQKFEQADSDAQVGAELSERLAKQLSDLQQKLDSESLEKDYNANRLIYWREHVSLLQRDLNAMAAENAALMKFCKNAAFDADYESELGMERGGFTDAINDIKTPATDAYLNSVRAEGLKMAIDHMNNQTSDDCADVTVLPVIEMYKKLISGTHDTADREG